MNRVSCLPFAVLAMFVFCLLRLPAGAATYYVWTNSPSGGPGTNWATAFHDIQTAVDVATNSGDTVLVTNGTYAAGGGTAPDGLLSNRVVIAKAISVSSVNGPAFTILVGQGPLGAGAVRCAYLANGAVLSGFTLSNGCTLALSDTDSPDRSGGGAYVEGGISGAVISNCVIIGNSAQRGGGVRNGTLHNCVINGNFAVNGGGASDATLNNASISGNSSLNGGGAYYATLNNCTVSGNSAGHEGGGTYASDVYNSVVYYNTAASGPNYAGIGSYSYSCTTPDPDSGNGNMTAEPLLASASHLSTNSPCIGQGSHAFCSGLDIDGDVWLDPPCMGCDQVTIGAVTGSLTVAIVAQWRYVAVGFAASFFGDIRGEVSGSSWDFGDDAVLTNQPYAVHSWGTNADYTVKLTAWNETCPDGVSTTMTVHVVTQAVAYVSLTATNPVIPYLSWETASTNIQEAIDVSTALGGTVLVSNGVYATGGKTVRGSLLPSRIVVVNPITVQSVNGPQSTTILGQGPLGAGSAARCAYLANGAVLSGFTLSNGCTFAFGVGDTDLDQSGGGVDISGAVVVNCVISGNFAQYGGGVNGGTVNNCTVSGNSAVKSGGGVQNATANNCVITSNSAGNGGGMGLGTANNCVVNSNSASSYGGGVYYGTVNGCTIMDNSAALGGGGTYGEGRVANSIVYYNEPGGNASGGTYVNSCTTPAPGGSGNITNEPAFVNSEGGDFHLVCTSACVNAGDNASAVGETDLDGNPRIQVGTVDMGAYESPYWPIGTTGVCASAGVSAMGTNGCVLNWTVTTGWRYTLQKTPALGSEEWSDVQACTNMAGFGLMVITNDVDNASRMFYRLLATPQQEIIPGIRSGLSVH